MLRWIEAYFGGRGHGGRYNVNRKQVMESKIAVMGAVERGGDVRAYVMPDLTTSSIGKFLRDNIEQESTRLFTDASNRYNAVAQHYDRQSVNHKRKQFVSGDAHVNHVEQFWSHVKRSTKGTHKVISRKYFQSYLDGFAFHYNQRNDRQRFASLLCAVVG